MKRWLPVLLIGLGAAGLLSGWALYSSAGADGSPCGVPQIYNEYVKGTGDLTNGYACTDGTFTLYVSLVLLVVGGLMLLAGWFWAVPRFAPRITGRVRPLPLASFLLVGVLMVSAGGWFGWHQLQKYQDTRRLHAAEKVLAAMQLPAAWTGPTRLNRCTVSADARCAHSHEQPADLKDDLIALLHGHDTSQCTRRPATAYFPCGVDVTGEINGYRAVAFAQPDLYFEMDGKPPTGAISIPRTRGKPFYQDGSVIQILLITPEG